MLADQFFDNIFINNRGSSLPFTSKQKGGSQRKIPDRDRKKHGEWLTSRFQNIWDEAKKRNEERTAVSLPVKKGTYLEFFSSPDFELAIKSLENKRVGIRLMNVRIDEHEGQTVRRATVYIPEGKESYYLKRIRDYINPDKDTDKGKPKNENLVASIDNIRLAVLESFWPPSDLMWIPGEHAQWCEVWLNTDDDEDERRFRILVTETLQIPIQDESLKFPERRVLLIKANRSQLEELIEASSNIAEFRRAAEVASFFIDLDNQDQTEWAKELIDRVVLSDESDITISILDTGVNNGHILLKPILRDEDCHAYNDSWGTNDHEGHGTRMSGVVAYGDIQALLEGKEKIRLNHILESAKIIPPSGENDPKLFGAITSQIVSKLIIENPERKRIICMAITAPKYTTGDGRPSSWSAAIDELTSGFLDEQQKLFIVSGGNLVDPNKWKYYPESNQISSVQNPAQSWNAVTVGAYTEKAVSSKRNNFDVVAPRGGLSPYSTTSCLWDNKWPIKPEIVLEGGNVLKDSFGCFQSEDLSVLTTFFKPTIRQFDTIWATSAATAQAAWMAAQIQSKYPNAWPETIRGLLIHSANWTDTMVEQFLHSQKKRDINQLLRTCGYGVPSLERALWCVHNNVNLIIQSELQPFDYNGTRYVTKNMHLHELPWPKDVLLGLGETKVTMRVTLSYFIEPSPGEIGWKDRYRYASCALRFEVNGSDTKEAFLQKINAAIENEEDVETGESANWLIGKQNRHLGSVHSDIWSGTAAQLATSNMIGIYPAVGWWRERPHLGRWGNKIRYSLIVSLHTPEENIDLYTPIVTEINIDNTVSVEV